MTLRFSKTAVIFFSFIVLLSVNANLKAQDEPIILQKESLRDFLYEFVGGFPNLYIEPNLPEKFPEKREDYYGVPSSDTIVAFVDGSGSGKRKIKTGIAFGLKGLYVRNSDLSYAPGTQFISYLKLKSHEIWTIKSSVSGQLRELKIEFVSIEIASLSEREKETVQKMIFELKSKI